MKLYNCGITVNAENPRDIARFKKCGYVEVVEVVEKEEKAAEKQPSKSNKKDGE